MSALGGLIGSTIGEAIGGTFLGLSAAGIGQAIGTYLFSYLFRESTHITQEGPRLNNLKSSATDIEGSFINLVYGDTRISGSIIWASDVIETKNTETQSSGGKGGGGSTQTYTYYTYSQDLAVGICEGEITEVKRIWLNKTLAYQDVDGNVENNFDAGTTLTIYLGTETQQPSSLLESYLGVGTVPAFRGLAYITLEGLQLQKYGNRVPNIIEFETVTSNTSIKSIADDICARVNLTARDFNDISDIEIKGYNITSRNPARGALFPLIENFDIDSFENGSVLKMVKQTTNIDLKVDYDKLIDQDKYTIIRQDNIQGIKTLVLQYVSWDKGLQPATTTSTLQQVSNINKEAVEVPITLEDSVANELVNKKLRKSWEHLGNVLIKLPKEFTYLEPGDIIYIYTLNEPIYIKIIEIIQNPLQELEIKGISLLTKDFKYIANYTSYNDSDKVFYDINIVSNPIIIEVPYMDRIISQPEEKGYLVTGIEVDTQTLWPGGAILHSDENVNYKVAGILPNNLTVAKVISSQSNAIYEHYLDPSSVSLQTLNSLSYSLSSLSEDSFYLNKDLNIAIVLDSLYNFKELIRYKDVTPIDADKFTISNLNRGIGTSTIQTIVTNDLIVFLDESSSLFYNYLSTDINTTKYFKGQTLGSLNVTDAKQHTISGDFFKEEVPCNITSAVSGSDVLISWDFINRYDTIPFTNFYIAPSSYYFKIEIYNTTDSSLIRTIEDVYFTNSIDRFNYTYTSADMTTDGLSVSIPFIIKIYKKETYLGYRDSGTGWFSPDTNPADFYNGLLYVASSDTAGDSNTLVNLSTPNGTHISTNANATGVLFPDRIVKQGRPGLIAIGPQTTSSISGECTLITDEVDDEFTLLFQCYIPEGHNETTNLLGIRQNNYSQNFVYGFPEFIYIDNTNKLQGEYAVPTNRLITIGIVKTSSTTTPLPVSIYIDGEFKFNYTTSYAFRLGTDFYLGHASATPENKSVVYVGDIFYSETASASDEILKIYNCMKQLRGV